MTTPPIPILLVTVPEAMKALSVGRTHLYALLKARRLKVVKIGRSTRITIESIQAIASGGSLPTNDNVVEAS
jgi:excisionase family DNA binding protein